MKKKLGNMFDTTCGAVGHGVNMKGVMGAGVAKEFKQRFPDSFASYAKACVGDGDFYVGTAHYHRSGDTHTFNIASQFNPGPDAKYEWVLLGLISTAEIMNLFGITTIAIPMIGCGIGGLEWDKVEKIILAIEATYDIEFEVWKYE